MVDIFSRRDGPRAEDVAAKRMIDANRQAITGIADRLTAGSYSASRRQAAALPPPAAEPRRLHAVQTPTTIAPEPSPYLRISPNGRVVVADARSARQLHFLGELRRRDGRIRFVLATAENGFISPLEAGISDRLADLDGHPVDMAHPEAALATELTARLGLD